MSRKATNEYIGIKRRAYAQAGRAKRMRILDDVCETTGYERKYANRLLTGSRKFREHKGRGKTYGDEVVGTNRVMIATVNCHSSFRFPPQQFCRRPSSLQKPTTQSSPFRRACNTIQTHSSLPPPAPTGNQIAVWVLRGWCAPSEVLVRTICCSGAHQRTFCCAPFSYALMSLKTSHHLSNSLYRRRYAEIQSFNNHLIVGRR